MAAKFPVALGQRNLFEATVLLFIISIRFGNARICLRERLTLLLLFSQNAARLRWGRKGRIKRKR